MRKIITAGVFDYFHLGHLRFLENTKKLGDYLIVAVQDCESTNEIKPYKKRLYSIEQRLDIIKALRIVDEVIVYQDLEKALNQIDFDVFVISDDQTEEDFQRVIKWCKENNREIICLPKTLGIL